MVPKLNLDRILPLLLSAHAIFLYLNRLQNPNSFESVPFEQVEQFRSQSSKSVSWFSNLFPYFQQIFSKLLYFSRNNVVFSLSTNQINVLNYLHEVMRIYYVIQYTLRYHFSLNFLVHPRSRHENIEYSLMSFSFPCLINILRVTLTIFFLFHIFIVRSWMVLKIIFYFFIF